MIKFAVMTFMYNDWCNSDGSHEELIQMIGEAGVDGIEAFANHFMDDDDVLVNLYRKYMPENGVTMPVMDLLVNLAVAEPRERREAYELMRRGIDICDALGSEIVHLAGCAPATGMSMAEGRKWIAEGLNDFVDKIEQRGITLAFENFNPSPGLICAAADCLEILELSDPRVKFVFDTGNFAAVSENAEDNFTALFPRTCHFHIKDFTGEPGQGKYGGTPLGQGFINNVAVVELLKEHHYSGWVALESFAYAEPQEIIASELKTLKAMFA